VRECEGVWKGVWESVRECEGVWKGVWESFQEGGGWLVEAERDRGLMGGKSPTLLGFGFCDKICWLGLACVAAHPGFCSCVPSGQVLKFLCGSFWKLPGNVPGFPGLAFGLQADLVCFGP